MLKPSFVLQLPIKSEVYFKLQEAERETATTKQRFSSKDVLKAMRDAIRADHTEHA